MMNNSVDESGVVAMLTAIDSCERGVDLALSANSAGGLQSVRAVVSALTSPRAVTGLSLAFCILGDAAVRAICDPIHLNPCLLSLDLRSVGMTSDGAASVASALTENRSCRTLMLSANSICSRGGMALATMLSWNQTLTHFDLSRNQVLSLSLSLSLLLSVCPQLTTKYDLSRNQVSSEEAGRRFVEVLQSDAHAPISQLNMSANGMSAPIVEAFDAIVIGWQNHRKNGTFVNGIVREVMGEVWRLIDLLPDTHILASEEDAGLSFVTSPPAVVSPTPTKGSEEESDEDED